MECSAAAVGTALCITDADDQMLRNVSSFGQTALQVSSVTFFSLHYMSGSGNILEHSDENLKLETKVGQ